LSGDGALAGRPREGAGGDSSHHSLKLSTGLDRRFSAVFDWEEDVFDDGRDERANSKSSSQFSASALRRDDRGGVEKGMAVGEAVEPSPDMVASLMRKKCLIKFSIGKFG